MTHYLGIDPGKSGGFGFVPKSTLHKAFCFKMPETERDIADLIDKYKDMVLYAAIEKVHSMHGNGVKSMFTFGMNYGFLRGLLITYKLPFLNPLPNEWMSSLSCKTGGDKNVTKSKAQELFPYLSITHATADAVLIAEWLRKEKAEK